MRLNEDQQQLIIEFMNRVWPPSVACPMCKNNRWAIKNRILEVGDYSENKAEASALPPVPYITIICEKCGYCIFLDAVKVGVVNTKDARDKN